MVGLRGSRGGSVGSVGSVGNCDTALPSGECGVNGTLGSTVSIVSPSSKGNDDTIDTPGMNQAVPSIVGVDGGNTTDHGHGETLLSLSVAAEGDPGTSSAKGPSLNEDVKGSVKDGYEDDDDDDEDDDDDDNDGEDGVDDVEDASYSSESDTESDTEMSFDETEDGTKDDGASPPPSVGFARPGGSKNPLSEWQASSDPEDNIVYVSEVAQLEALFSQFDENIDGQINIAEEMTASFSLATRKGAGLEHGNAKLICRDRMKMVAKTNIILPSRVAYTKDGYPISGSNTRCIHFGDLRTMPHCTETKQNTLKYAKLAIELGVMVVVHLGNPKVSVPLNKEFGPVVTIGRDQLRQLCPDSPYLDPERLERFWKDVCLYPNDASSKAHAKSNGKGKNGTVNRRGNMRLEDGKAGNQCCIIDDLGLAAPGTRVIPLQVDQGMLGCYRSGLSEIASLLWTPTTTPARHTAYVKERLLKMVEAEYGPLELFEARYFCLVNLKTGQTVIIHVDHLNCNKPGMAFTMTIVGTVILDSDPWRFTTVGTSRASVGIYFDNLNKYGGLLRRVYGWTATLPHDRKFITRTILHPSPNPLAGASASDQPIPIPVHLDKCVFYSNCLGVVWHVCTRFSVGGAMDPASYVVNGLLFCCILTHNNNYYWEFGQTLMRKKTLPADGLELVRMGIDFYKSITVQVKEGRRKPAKGARHQPHSGKCDFTDEQIGAALDNIAEIRRLIQSVLPYSPALYEQICGIALQVPCIGPFLKHHLVILAAMFAARTDFLGHENIMSTKTHTCKRILEDYPALNDGDLAENLSIAVKAYARHEGVSLITAENAFCEFYRHLGKKSAIRDLRLPGMPYIFLDQVTKEWKAWVHSSETPVLFSDYTLSMQMSCQAKTGKRNKLTSRISEMDSPIAKKTRSCRNSSTSAVVELINSDSSRSGRPNLRSASLSTLSGSSSITSIPVLPAAVSLKPVVKGRTNITQAPLVRYPSVHYNMNRIIGTILGRPGRFQLKEAVTFSCRRISDLKLKGRKVDNTHTLAYSAILADVTGKHLQYGAASSSAIHLFDRYSLYLCREDKVYFQDKFTAIKYAIWSTILQETNEKHLKMFVHHLFESPLLPCDGDQDEESPGRLLLPPNVNNRSKSHCFFVQRDNEHYELGLLSKKGNRLGSGVILEL